ncbi:MAG: hypothetical protein DGJ47_000889 [Rickettsiaceae bacterium]
MQDYRKNLIANLNHFIKESNLSPAETSKLAAIPKSTLYSLLSGETEPQLSTLYALCNFFNVSFGQILGESPLISNEHQIPILNWPDLNHKTGEIEFSIGPNTTFLTTSIVTKNTLYALLLDKDIYTKYKKGSMFIVENSQEFTNNDIILISIAQGDVTLKKILIESNACFLKSLSDDIPIIPYSKKNSYVFGILREVRISS